LPAPRKRAAQLALDSPQSVVRMQILTAQHLYGIC